jgi:hypothetical protein
VSEDAGMARERRRASEPRRPRGWVSLYAVAFFLLVGAGVGIALAAASLLRTTAWLWASTILSAAAIVLAVVAVLLPRR